MENLEGLCKIKLIALTTFSLEQGIKYCYFNCNGYKNDCPYYSPLTKKDIKNYQSLSDGLKH